MSVMNVGRICTVKEGRRKGSEVTITNLIDQNFVSTKDAKGKDRKYAIMHLEPKA